MVQFLSSLFLLKSCQKHLEGAWWENHKISCQISENSPWKRLKLSICSHYKQVIAILVKLWVKNIYPTLTVLLSNTSKPPDTCHKCILWLMAANYKLALRKAISFCLSLVAVNTSYCHLQHIVFSFFDVHKKYVWKNTIMLMCFKQVFEKHSPSRVLWHCRVQLCCCSLLLRLLSIPCCRDICTNKPII